jgi:hypothetical protein
MTLTTIIVSLLTLATNHSMAQTAPNIPIEVGNGVRDVAYANISLYLNITDCHYHLELKKIDANPKVCFITAYETYYEELKKDFPTL